MWIRDPQRGVSLAEAQLYLSPDEARAFVDALTKLLANPDAVGQERVGDGVQCMISIVTPDKLATGRYTTEERRALEA